MGTKSSSSSSSRRQQRWCNSSSQGTMLTPLMEGPDVHQMHHHHPKKHDVPSTSSTSSWDAIREWFGAQRSISSSTTSTNDSFFNSVSSSSSSSSNNGSGGESEINARGSSSYCYSNNSNDHMWGKRQDLRLLLGVLGCPLAPIPIPIPVRTHHQIIISTTSSAITTTTINHNNHHHPLPLIPIRDIPIVSITTFIIFFSILLYSYIYIQIN